MLTYILIIWVVLGIVLVAITSKGTFYVEDAKNIGWQSYAIGIVLLCLFTPVFVAEGIIEGLKEALKD